ncbi:MAG: hypothetical protein JO199_10320, partial [Candidatus Eremiobacteraeota bacterium]|nr:hypothetical protein [Candidatus Eremiobacteraeota bacterium]
MAVAALAGVVSACGAGRGLTPTPPLQSFIRPAAGCSGITPYSGGISLGIANASGQRTPAYLMVVGNNQYLDTSTGTMQPWSSSLKPTQYEFPAGCFSKAKPFHLPSSVNRMYVSFGMLSNVMSSNGEPFCCE